MERKDESRAASIPAKQAEASEKLIKVSSMLLNLHFQALFYLIQRRAKARD